MGALKQEFHEVLAGEHGAVEDLHEASNAAWAVYRGLLSSLPVYRSPEQERLLSRAHAAAEAAKWRYDTAKFWAEYNERDRA